MSDARTYADDDTSDEANSWREAQRKERENRNENNNKQIRPRDGSEGISYAVQSVVDDDLISNLTKRDGENNATTLVPFDRKTTVATIEGLLSSSIMSATLDLSKISVPKMINMAMPGVCTKTHMREGMGALVNLHKDLGGADGDRNIFAFITSVLQSFTSFSTSPNISTSDDRTMVAVVEENKTQVIPYNRVKMSLDNSVGQRGYQNASRSFGRSMSALIIQLTANGNIEPNVKTCSAHGLPPQYFAYGADCLVVDPRLWGYDATLAAEMAKMVAINKGGRSGTQIHNLFERTDASPPIFLGGRTK
ncbi:coat protein [Firespike leaf roll-associated virus]|nr:coat protein [Firespike leaf roll-associated virus]